MSISSNLSIVYDHDQYFVNFTKYCVIVSFLTKLLVSVIRIALRILTNSSYTVFLTASFFTTSLRLLKSIGVVSNLPISNSSISDFQPSKSTWLANFDLSRPAGFYKSAFVA